MKKKLNTTRGATQRHGAPKGHMRPVQEIWEERLGLYIFMFYGLICLYLVFWKLEECCVLCINDSKKGNYHQETKDRERNL